MADKFERLLSLFAELMETRRPLAIGEIRERVEGYSGYENDDSFRQAFERDKADLRDMGIEIDLVPIEFGEPNQTGYRIAAHDYVMDDIGLEPDELAALQLALALVEVSEEGGRALGKLGGLENPGLVQSAVAEVPITPGIEQVFQAVTTAALLTFAYRGEQRHVQAHALRFERGRWYLGGFDLDRDADRVFRVDRIEGEPVVGPPGAFQQPAEPVRFELDPWRLGAGERESVVATVLVDADHVDRIRLTVGEDAITVLPNGDAEVTFDVSNPAALRSLVLDLGPHAEEASPPGLRADMVAWLEDLASS